MKDAVRLQRSDLENFMNTGLIQKPIFSTIIITFRCVK